MIADPYVPGVANGYERRANLVESRPVQWRPMPLLCYTFPFCFLGWFLSVYGFSILSITHPFCPITLIQKKKKLVNDDVFLGENEVSVDLTNY